MSGRETASDLDIAVVGAGIAGLYATWRLLERGIRPDRIGLFEASDRVGGRVLTVQSPQGLTIDIGAHTYSRSHKIVAGLIERFGLRPVASAGRSPAGIVHLRGRSLTNAEIARSWFRRPFAYDVSAYVQRRGPARMLRKALEKMPFDPQAKARRLRGRPLAEWALSDALLEVLSPEELRYLTDRLVYSFWQRPVQAEAALAWAAQEIFRGNDGMIELPGGMAGLPEALAKAISDLGGAIQSGNRLAAVELPGGAGRIALSFETAAGRRSVTAERVVLALPAAAIGRVDGLAGKQEIDTLIGALMPQQAAVTALVYPEPWWRRIGMAGGVSATDLPARHLRHDGAEPWRASPGLGALVSYSDGESAGFWRGLRGEDVKGWVDPDHSIAAELHRQLDRMFGPKVRKPLPRPLCAFTQDWSEGGAGAAFHLWTAGSRPEASMEEALQPFQGQKLHICGEAWSKRQGWIEGALETVDTLIGRHMEAG